MRDTCHGEEQAPDSGHGTDRIALALEVIGHLVARKASRDRMIDEILLDRMVHSAYGPDRRGLESLLAEMRAARISDAQIVDGYIPVAARRLGLDWEADRISFADVTVGAARLSGLLHGMGLDCTANDAQPNGQDTLLLIVPIGEQHTLGAAILAGQLRRKGLSVCFRLGPSLSDLAGLTAARHFRGALISIGSQDRIETCSMLVRTLHTLSKGTLRVVVGGAIVGSGSPDLLALGADAVTNEIEAALGVFGLDVPRQGVA